MLDGQSWDWQQGEGIIFIEFVRVASVKWPRLAHGKVSYLEPVWHGAKLLFCLISVGGKFMWVGI